MSRGLGKCQRLILDKVMTGDSFYLVDLLPQGYTAKDYQALHRAFVSLEKAGKISVIKYLCGSKKVLIQGPGAEKPSRRPNYKSRNGGKFSTTSTLKS